MRKNNFFGLLGRHFEDNFWIYVVSIFCVFTGIVLGIYTVKYMGQLEKSELVTYLTGFSDAFGKNEISYKAIFLESLKNNLPLIIAIWFLGLTMIGTPVILIIDVIKGYTIGFTISFLINGLGVKGIWIALLSILPQNIIYIPCIVFASVAAMEFSLMLLKDNMYKHWTSNVFARISSYSIIFVGVFLCMAVGFVVEAYITPFFLKLFVG